MNENLIMAIFLLIMLVVVGTYVYITNKKMSDSKPQGSFNYNQCIKSGMKQYEIKSVDVKHQNQLASRGNIRLAIGREVSQEQLDKWRSDSLKLEDLIP